VVGPRTVWQAGLKDHWETSSPGAFHAGSKKVELWYPEISRRRSIRPLNNRSADMYA
jgi:hypothetical protein